MATFDSLIDPLAEAWREILDSHRCDEARALGRFLAALPRDAAFDGIEESAAILARSVREALLAHSGAEGFLRNYGLSSREGVVLMCLAEALLRIPDAPTADELIRDKLPGTEWEAYLADDAGLANAATWGLMLTGRLAAWSLESGDAPVTLVRRLVGRLGEPIARAALTQAMRILAGQFVCGETLETALAAAATGEARGYRYSYDMLGEAALGAEDAHRYFNAYCDAIESIGAAAARRGPLDGPEISVKLSALHPRFEPAQRQRVLDELGGRLSELARRAAAADIGLTIDAEECDRLVPTLELFDRLARDPALEGWTGLGLAVQAYQKRALPVLDWLIALAAHTGRRLRVRLVKGAYWDSEIKAAQARGLDYPVLTRKPATDVAYLACAARLLEAGERVYPMFATHNCHSVAAVMAWVGSRRDFEFQKLFGMGDALYDPLVAEGAVSCRVYAPVGGHRELLPYLVRRLLENGANSSFVHQIGDPAVPVERLVADPRFRLPRPYRPHDRIPPPGALYGERRNSASLDLADQRVLDRLADSVRQARLTHVPPPGEGERGICDPSDSRRRVGVIRELTAGEVDPAVAKACAAFDTWNGRPVEARAAMLERTADLMESLMERLIVLCVSEAGKTLPAALAEVREAVDFCRYYAAEARRRFAEPLALPGPTGERNLLAWRGRGAFACISPWNFPLAIFTGQVAAALVAGNTVIAKPAEQTPLIARAAVSLFHEAGVPLGALQLAPGPGETIGAMLVADPRVAGVAFTGSVDTAKAIQRALAARDGPIVPLIAETGGMNAMIVDSSALPEHVVRDAIVSAFDSAGQRCSALRVLAVQDDIAERVIALLAGAMRELAVGDPGLPATDIGPVIDAGARAALESYRDRLRAAGRVICELAVPAEAAHGHYFAPIACEIPLENLPQREVFGPVLHVVRYRGADLDRVLAAIAATGYGLTLGIQSRIDSFVERVAARLPAGNVYVNRNMIGAVVGSQPFGGIGLSGTGPKAGGPEYLARLAVERTLSANTAAVGGNMQLLSAGD